MPRRKPIGGPLPESVEGRLPKAFVAESHKSFLQHLLTIVGKIESGQLPSPDDTKRLAFYVRQCAENDLSQVPRRRRGNPATKLPDDVAVKWATLVVNGTSRTAAHAKLAEKYGTQPEAVRKAVKRDGGELFIRLVNKDGSLRVIRGWEPNPDGDGSEQIDLVPVS